ncbi:MAG TPA: hypothetical protein VMN39_02365 [Longimicrobiaceae bacterium]|nr:hypothetical protein [Longimicrobiaceae bacterium]
MHVTVEGAAGSGRVIVPVPARATRIADMSIGLRAALMGLGIFLFIGLLSIVGAAAREASLPPGAEVDARRRRRSRVAQAAAVPLLALALLGGARWWEAEEGFYERNLYVPLAIDTRAIPGADGRELVLEITDARWTPQRFTPLLPDHGKLMHLFLVRAPGLDAFAHLHPAALDSATFRTALPALPAGEYRVYADILHESGFTQTLTDTIVVPGPTGAETVNLDPDDSWLVSAAATPPGGRAPLEDGSTMVWTGETALRAGAETTLIFDVRDPAGAPAALQPYMGMAAHAAISRDDGSVFVHLHPLGTISMTSQRLFEDRAGGAGGAGGTRAMDPSAHPGVVGSSVDFPYEFPAPGSYGVWVQVKREGRVLTGSFAVEVVP